MQSFMKMEDKADYVETVDSFATTSAPILKFVL